MKINWTIFLAPCQSKDNISVLRCSFPLNFLNYTVHPNSLAFYSPYRRFKYCTGLLKGWPSSQTCISHIPVSKSGKTRFSLWTVRAFEPTSGTDNCLVSATLGQVVSVTRRKRLWPAECDSHVCVWDGHGWGQMDFRVSFGQGQDQLVWMVCRVTDCWRFRHVVIKLGKQQKQVHM